MPPKTNLNCSAKNKQATKRQKTEIKCTLTEAIENTPAMHNINRFKPKLSPLVIWHESSRNKTVKLGYDHTIILHKNIDTQDCCVPCLKSNHSKAAKPG